MNKRNLALTLVGLLAAPLVAAEGAAVTYQPPKEQARAEIKWVKEICVEKDRYIGWPTVCRLANGDLLTGFSGFDQVLPLSRERMRK